MRYFYGFFLEVLKGLFCWILKNRVKWDFNYFKSKRFVLVYFLLYVMKLGVKRIVCNLVILL